MTRSHWLFLRAYLLIVLLIGLGGLGLDQLLDQRQESESLSHDQQKLLGSFLYLENVSLTQDNIEAGLHDTATKKLGYAVVLYPLTDFSSFEEHVSALTSGETLTFYDEEDLPIYYRRLASADWVAALGPIRSKQSEPAAWPVAVFYVLVALGVYLWIRPLSRDLQSLQAAARAFGEQDFSTRVAVPATSWLAPLGTSFNSLAERIQWLLSSHRDLTHAVSHELRTPLARLRFSLELLEVEDSPQNDRYLADINRDIDELNELLEEMLRYAELEQDNLQARLETVSLASWLKNYAGSRPAASDAPVVETVIKLEREDQKIAVDSRLLKRALDNLVGNAMRYASAHIELVLEESPMGFRLTVADDGPGIPPDKREAALTAYTRLPASDGEVSRGFGLGLAIVKRIVDLHHGVIQIHDSTLGGAAVSLDLPDQQHSHNT
jgi:signal transduction histidine kinase